MHATKVSNMVAALNTNLVNGSRWITWSRIIIQIASSIKDCWCTHSFLLFRISCKFPVHVHKDEQNECYYNDVITSMVIHSMRDN